MIQSPALRSLILSPALCQILLRSFLRASVLMLGQGHYVHIAALLVLCPVDVVCHLRLRVELHALEDLLHESLVAHTVDQMAAV